jgi:AcrR family transcriptional regulator
VSRREELLGQVVAWFAAHGIGDTSLRTLARELGTSHRMLIYHFGSREGLLTEVVGAVEAGERAALAALLEVAHEDPYAAGAAFWTHVADAATTFAPLFFEVSGLAMQGASYAAGLRSWLADGWLDGLAAGFEAGGFTPSRSRELAQESLAMARGLLFELAVTRGSPRGSTRPWVDMSKKSDSGGIRWDASTFLTGRAIDATRDSAQHCERWNQPSGPPA